RHVVNDIKMLCFSEKNQYFFSSRRRHTRFSRDWSSDVCSSDLTHRWSSSAFFFSVSRSGTRTVPPPMLRIQKRPRHSAGGSSHQIGRASSRLRIYITVHNKYINRQSEDEEINHKL